MQNNNIELACGLIGIGRVWGVKEAPVPSEQDALAFLDAALAQSIGYYDTAPSYGSSEVRLGKWLKTLTGEQRTGITIATKFGEHWSEGDQKPYVDHSFEALRMSLDQSLARLGNIDILQLHKTNPAVLKSDDLKRAWEYAKERGVETIGVSVSDLESGEMACEDDQYSLIQLPINQQNTTFAPIIQEATKRGKRIVTNRPFNMGETVNGNETKSKAELEHEAFDFILRQFFNGFILTGTKSPAHLEENMTAFMAAKNSI
ncbi:MAG: aldo/keto reductase [bacterium]|nr:aldo/keto reductase [bacterium]